MLRREVLLGECFELVEVFDVSIGLLEFLELERVGVVGAEALLEVLKEDDDLLVAEFDLVLHFGDVAHLLDFFELQGLDEEEFELEEVFVGDEGAAVDFADEGGAVLHDVFGFVEVSVFDGLVEGDAGVLALQVVDGDVVVSDDDVDEVELLLLEDLEEVEDLVEELGEVEVVVAVLLLRQDLVEDLQLLEDLLVQEAVVVDARLHQRLQLRPQPLLVAVQSGEDLPLYLLHLHPQVLLQVERVLLVLLPVVQDLDESLQLLRVGQVVLQSLRWLLLLDLLVGGDEAVEGGLYGFVEDFVLREAGVAVLRELCVEVVGEGVVVVDFFDEFELADVLVVGGDLGVELGEQLPELLEQLREEVDLDAVVYVLVVEGAHQVDLLHHPLQLLPPLRLQVEDVAHVYLLQVQLEVLHEVHDVVRHDRLLLLEDLLQHWVLGGLPHCLVLAHQQLHLLQLLRGGFRVGFVEGLELRNDEVVVPGDVLLELVEFLVVVLEGVALALDVVSQLHVLRR